MALNLISTAFEHHGHIPDAHAYDGGDRSPPLRWAGVPADTKTLALIMEDPEAPQGNFVHWLAYNIPAGKGGLDAGIQHRGDKTEGTLQGRNDFDELGYGGPQPPPGERHRYVFRLYAVDSRLDLEPGADKVTLEHALRGHTLDEARLVGVYGGRG